MSNDVYFTQAYQREVQQAEVQRDEEAMRRMDNRSGSHSSLPAYVARSPTAAKHPSYSPVNGTGQPSPYNRYASRPSSSHVMADSSRSPRLGPPPSPTNGLPHINRTSHGSREHGSSTYYDPTSEHREGAAGWNGSPYAGPSPIMAHDTSSYHEREYERRRSKASLHSPTSSRCPPQASPTATTPHAHPSHHTSIAQSPIAATLRSPQPLHNPLSISHLTSSHDAPAEEESMVRLKLRGPAPPVEEHKPARADPMAFSSILSSTTSEAAPSPRRTPALKLVHKAYTASTGDIAMPDAPERTRGEPSGVSSYVLPAVHAKEEDTLALATRDPVKMKLSRPHLSAKRSSHAPSPTDAEVRQALAEIDAQVMSDVDSAEWDMAKKMFDQKALKRVHIIEVDLAAKVKRVRVAAGRKPCKELDRAWKASGEEFRQSHEGDVISEVQRQDVQDEKERKKDMQRKRRWEKTVQNETQKQQEAIHKAQLATDKEERERLLKEAQKAEKKAKSTKRILDHGDGPDESGQLAVIPFDGESGHLSKLSTNPDASPEPPRKKHKGPTTRPKKAKEKKPAPKDTAEAAEAAMDPEELVSLAPKEESRKEALQREAKEAKAAKDSSPAAAPTNYASKGYQQIYEQIWKDIARKDIPKVYRIKENTLTVKQSNMRKTAQLASKEARRWQLRTNKSTKETQAKSKRAMREMAVYWKRNEREERDARRVAEKQELDNARKAEADREANRQKRKLNFLISQTELYSHFIGRKIRTNEVERSTDSVDATAPAAAAVTTTTTAQEPAATIDLPDAAPSDARPTNFEDLDFDTDDEAKLQRTAMANAQNAVQEAQDRARAFNHQEDSEQAQLDDGEMNFQNPTSLGDVDVSQPKMLTCQLKEYQLKGLNWLVNLYEQGINGILADEMGLGKTVQSISVMAYLAEKHNIWGPFLVIAPSSTLHNWQQEITRFVPDLKVLPYWGTAKDRKVLRKFWDRKHITYTRDSPFHVLITSYQLVVQDTQYFQKIRWQYMILDEAQAIKSSQSSRWKSLLGFHCRNRLLLTGTPIQNNMQELWALLHFIMPSLFDSHDEFSDWFSKDIESHAQSNTKLNEDQLKRLHMILKPFMLRRIKKHVQKELGDKIEEDVYCDLTYRQRAYYGNLRNRISIMDLIEKAAVGDDQDAATLMNLVMQFRKVCNHPDLFERADTTSPFAMVHFAECASFLREGPSVSLGYSTRNAIEYELPRFLCSPAGRLGMAGPGNDRAGWEHQTFRQLFNIWTPENIRLRLAEDQAFAWLRLSDVSPGEAYEASHTDLFTRAFGLARATPELSRRHVLDDDGADAGSSRRSAMLRIVDSHSLRPRADVATEGYMRQLLNVSQDTFDASGMRTVEQCARPAASAPPIQISSSDQTSVIETSNTFFNVPFRKALYGLSIKDELALLEANVDPLHYPVHSMLPPPLSERSRFTHIQVPSMSRFVTDSGKLAKLDALLRMLKNGGHRVLLYFQMTRMMDLMEEYLTYRNHKYLRLDGSTKLEDRRDTVHDFQTRPEIFVFLLSTRAGGLGINLTAADTVIFYDSDWNPTIDSQAMDRAHRLGQTRQVTVYRMITRGTIEERIRKRALQKEEVQRVVISGGAGGSAGAAVGVDFSSRSKENRTKDIAMWLADDEQAEMIEKKEKEVAEKAEENGKKGKRKAMPKKRDISMDDMYHEGEGHFDDGSNKPSGAATPVDAGPVGAKKGDLPVGKGMSKKAKTAKQRLAMADGTA